MLFKKLSRRNRLFLTVVLAIFLSGAEGISQSVPPPNWTRQMFQSGESSVLLPEFNDSYGVVFRDINGDEWPDLYVVRFRNLNRLFINSRNGQSLKDFTIRSGLGGNLQPHKQQNLELGASAVDMDNDGHTDVMIIGWGETTRVYRQTESFRFSPIKLPLSHSHPIDGNAGIWADIDRDGDLDLFISDEHHSNHLLLNDGTGHFTEAAAQYGLNGSAVSQGASFADVDGDGWPDLYVCNWFAPDDFYRNINGRRFQKMDLNLPHLTRNLRSNGITFADLNNDGKLDFYVTDRDSQSALYWNESDSSGWHFRPDTSQSGIINPYPAYGSVIADFNNDGFPDIFVSNIGPNMLFLNRDGKNFELVYRQKVRSLGPKINYSTGAAAADFDRDGDLDLFVANKDTHSVFFLNPTNNSNFIRIALEGVESNRDAIGTKIWLYQEKDGEELILKGFQEISGGGGYLSLSEPIAHFGVTAGKIYRAVVQFPSGKTITRKHLLPGTRLKVIESHGLSAVIFRAIHLGQRIIHSPNFGQNVVLILLIGVLLAAFARRGSRRYRWKPEKTILIILVEIIILLLLRYVFPEWRLSFLLRVYLIVLLVGKGSIILFQEKVRKIEARRSVSREILQNFSRKLIFIKNNVELFSDLTATICKALPVRFCAVFTPEGNKLQKAAASGEIPNTMQELVLNSGMMESLLKNRSITRARSAKLLTFFGDDQIEAVFSIARENHLFALIMMGRRPDGQEISGEDLQLLNILANQASIAVENNLYIEEVRQLAQKIASAEVREKYVKELEEKNRSLKKLFRELQDTQTQLIQSEKMASLGQLVAGIAHELNNPISFIYANMRNLQRYIKVINQILECLVQKPDDPESLRKIVKQLDAGQDLKFIHSDIQNLIAESVEGSNRVKEVVQNLRNFSRLDEADLKKVDIHEGLDSTLLLLKNETKNRISVHKQYGVIPLVECHPGQLNQVFMNLLLNAIQAIEKEGNIWIETRQTDYSVEIIIKDDGAGISESDRAKIFDPFFSTKPVGKGTGLGLSISYKIIEAHGGTIEVESQPGSGSTFRIRLPLRSRKSGSAETGNSANRVPPLNPKHPMPKPSE